MPRYLVERTYADALPWQAVDPVAQVAINAQQGVTWLHSYVTQVAPNQARSYCVIDGPSPEAVRLAARANGLPMDRICEVRVFEPYAMPVPDGGHHA